MTARLTVVGIVVLALLGWIASMAFYTVQQSQQALVVRLGQPVGAETTPGLKTKMPFVDSVVFYEKRLLPLQPVADQIILGDQKRIEVETFSLFRIADPLKFFQAVGTEDQARSQLGQIVSTTLRKQLGKVDLPALLTGERARITTRLRDEVADEARPLGIEVVDVQLRRVDLPVETSQAIYDRMTSERVREAKEVRAQGFEAGAQIRSKADRERTVLLSEAQREAQKSRGQGDADANRISVAAYGQDPEFYDLYRTLQLYRTALGQGSPTIVLSPSSSLMKFFDAGPPP